MKNGMAIITAVVVLTVTGLAFAQMNDKGGSMMDKGDKGGMMGGGMMGGGMMGKGGMMMGMHGMMMKMMEKSVTATSDGGIVIVAGDKITKYDKDLNLVKEVELKSNMEAMQKMMSQMMEKCPMMGGMGQEGKTDATPAAAQVDHASHH